MASMADNKNAWRDSLRIRTAVPRSQVFDPSPLLAHRDDGSVPSSPRTPPLPTTVPAWMANTDRERAAIELGLLHNNSEEFRDPNSAPADQPMQRAGLSRTGSYQTLSFATGGPASLSRNGSYASMPRASALQRPSSLLFDDELTNQANVASSTPPEGLHGALPSMQDFFSTANADDENDEHYLIVDGKVVMDENGKHAAGKHAASSSSRPKSMGPKSLSFMSFSRRDRLERTGGSATSTPNDTPTTTPRPSVLSGIFSRSRPGSMRLPHKADNNDDLNDLSRPSTPDTPAVVFKVGARASAAIP